MQIQINNTYSGPFEHVGKIGDALKFESVQKLSSVHTTQLYLSDVGVHPQPAGQNDLEVNTVSWTVDPKGRITGTAKFLAVTTHDLIKATLDGEATSAKGYQLARVKVTFAGGTGAFAKATGHAEVVAKLFENGLSVGHISGSVSA